MDPDVFLRITLVPFLGFFFPLFEILQRLSEARDHRTILVDSRPATRAAIYVGELGRVLEPVESAQLDHIIIDITADNFFCGAFPPGMPYYFRSLHGD